MKSGYINELKNNLPVLAFDPERDVSIDDWPVCREYLDFYSFPRIDGVKHFLGSFDHLGYKLACHYFLPEKPVATVCIQHGYFDHMGLYNHLIDYLLQRRYAVVGYDLPGHGLSSGEKVSIESFHHYVQVFSRLLDSLNTLPGPIHAVGQSTGGAVLLNYLLLCQFLVQPIKLDKVVLLAPLVRPTGWRRIQLAYKLTRRFRKRVKRRFLANSSDLEFLDFISDRDPLQSREASIEWVGAMRQWVHDFSILPKCKHPLTIVQGGLDTTVDWRYNLKVIKKKFPRTRVTMQPDAGHHLVNESPDLRRRIFKALEL